MIKWKKLKKVKIKNLHVIIIFRLETVIDKISKNIKLYRILNIRLVEKN